MAQLLIFKLVVSLARGPLARAVLVLGIVVVAGMLGLMATEGWSAWEAFFVTLITVTTVGYGDHEVGPNGEIVLAFIMVIGIGCATYALGGFVRAAVEAAADKERAMEREVARLRDHVIVCGLGRVGWAVCDQLEEVSRPFVVVDTSEDAIEAAREKGYLALGRDATNDDALTECGIVRASAVVAVASDDATNVVVTFTARALNEGVPIFSRAEREDSIRKIKRAGADHVVSPTLIGGRHIVEALVRPTMAAMLDEYEMDESGFRLKQIHVPGGGAVEGKTIEAFGREHPGVALVAICSGEAGGHRRPMPDDRLHADDVLVVAGQQEDLLRAIDAIGAVGRRAA